jgi:chemotaxis protein methyltransferase CheR
MQTLRVPRFAMPAGHPSGWRLRPPTEQEFRRLAELVDETAGIVLNETKHALVVRRLSARIRELGLDRLGDYAELVRADDSRSELTVLLNLIATNETHFFREAQHWQYLEDRVIPDWLAAAGTSRRARVVRAWSAACSTGQEPYSLAMQLLTHLPVADGWRHDIIATDISTTALDTARAAEWSIERASEIPGEYLQQYMLRGTGERIGRMRACRELRDAVRFDRLNLNEERYDVPGSFDLIFCRNVLIYFSAPGRAAVIDRLADRLAPGGLLFVGHAESLHTHRDRLRAVLPTVYTLAA